MYLIITTLVDKPDYGQASTFTDLSDLFKFINVSSLIPAVLHRTWHSLPEWGMSVSCGFLKSQDFAGTIIQVVVN